MKVAVLGAGSWGIALANLCAEKEHDVNLWEFRPDVAEVLDHQRENVNALPGVSILAQHYYYF